MKYYTYETNLSDRNKFTSEVVTTFGNRRYFSSLDTEVYFGEEQVDEIVAIDFTIAEPKLPIYGYNSFYPNRIVAGRRTLQGTFAINFTDTMYLLNILERIDDSILANDYEAYTFRCPEEDSTGLGIGNSPIFTKRFDITISYGYGKSETPSYKGCYQTLVGVQIVDYRQALDTDGNPILDMYSFIAKDIRYPVNNSTTKPNDDVKSPTTSTTNPDADIKDPTQVPSEELEEQKAPEPLMANGWDTPGMNEIVAKCSDPEIDGFIITPNIQIGTDGEYYFNLSLDTINNKTETFKNINITAVDHNLGVDLSFGLDDRPIGYTTLQLEGTMRDATIKLFNEKEKNPDYKIDCTIEFDAVIDKAYVSLDFETFLMIGVYD